MSTIKVAINGFGRIGRLVYRQIYNMQGIDVVAINDLTSPATLAHLLKYDSTHGKFNAEISSKENFIFINNDKIEFLNKKPATFCGWPTSSSLPLQGGATCRTDLGRR